MKKWLAALIPASLVLAACAPPPPPEPTTNTIADVLLADAAGDNADGFDSYFYDFDIVTQAVLLFPDLVAAASNAEADLTVFAPNDRAFQVLVADLTGKWLWNEKAIFEAVASLGTETVKTVLTYHIIGSGIPAADALKANGATLTTLQTGTLGVKVGGAPFSMITLVDNDPDYWNPQVVTTKYNVGGALANGYIHGISGVLRPIDL